MSTVPYIFAGDTGNIPLSQLDVNFANVKASTDYVIANAQANITSVGTLTALSVSGNILVAGNVSAGGNVIIGNVTMTGQGNIAGNVSAGNVLTIGLISATGNVTGGNVLTSGVVSATGNITGGNITTAGLITAPGNITGANITTAGLITATGNVTGGNITTAGLITATGNVTGGNIITTGISSRYLDVSVPIYANITATGTYSLSITNSINILIANNTGYTATLNMPTAPRDGQICNFAVSGNVVTLAVGTGTVIPTFAGSTSVGTGYRYVYRLSNTSWYRIG